MDRTRELEEQIRKLSTTIEEMRARLARLEDDPDASGAARVASRRGFLRLGGAAAAGALGLAASRVIPVSAANGDPLTVGGNVTGDDTLATRLSSSAFQGKATSFSLANFTTAVAGESFDGPLQAYGADDGTVPNADGLEGFASGSTSFGVWGLTDSGTGVTGQANTGIGLYARGTGRIRQDPQAGAGTPNYTPNAMEQARDANGVLFIHSATGTAPSMWRRVNTLRVDTPDGLGNPFQPFRLYDSRSGARPAKGSKTTVQVTGLGGSPNLPADAIAIVGNLTATQYAGPGYITLAPSGTPQPPTSSVNFITGQGAIANAFVVGLAGGAIDVYVSNNNPSHFIIDITAYIQ